MHQKKKLKVKNALAYDRKIKKSYGTLKHNLLSRGKKGCIEKKNREKNGY